MEQNLVENPKLELSKAVKNLKPGDEGDCWLHKTNDWLPAWFYYFDENGVILHDEDTTKNGILIENGIRYYYIDGIKAPAGMIQIGNDYYYVNSKAQLIVDQDYYCSRTNGIKDPGYYSFDSEGKLIQESKNGIYEEDGTLRYYVNGKPTYVGLIEIDGDYYYVNSKCEVVHDCSYYITWTHGLKEPGYYNFDSKGRMQEQLKNGIVAEDGTLRYYVNGKPTYMGLIKIDGDYYYVNSKCEVVHNCTYYISWTHDLLPQGEYNFDENGKMINPPVPTDPTKNGIITEDGTLYYYVNGERTYAGLIEIDGDYYYVNSSCKVVTTTHYWVNKTNGLLPTGFYDFDADGKMTNPPQYDMSKNGIIEEDGELYYYVNGVRTYAGLIEINGDYYYVNSSCKIVTTTHYWVNKTNNLLPAGFYDFGADGKMTVKTEEKN